MKFTIALVISIFALGACSSRPVLPDSKDIKVSRETPDKSCLELGNLTGRTATIKGTREQALEDLKQEAANKGANYVMIKQYSDSGTAVTGIAFECR